MLNVNYLLKDLKAEIRFYFSLKYNQKRFDETELETIRTYFSSLSLVYFWLLPVKHNFLMLFDVILVM